MTNYNFSEKANQSEGRGCEEDAAAVGSRATLSPSVPLFVLTAPDVTQFKFQWKPALLQWCHKVEVKNN
jgi:hypothetical protein